MQLDSVAAYLDPISCFQVMYDDTVSLMKEGENGQGMSHPTEGQCIPENAAQPLSLSSSHQEGSGNGFLSCEFLFAFHVAGITIILVQRYEKTPKSYRHK